MPLPATVAHASPAGPWLHASASDDVDHHCENLGRWQLDYDQIGRGRFAGSFTEVRLPNLQVFRETTSQKVRQYGQLGADNFVIGLPWTDCGDIHFNGSSMSGGNVIACLNTEIDLCTPPGFELRGVMMDASLVESALSATQTDLALGAWHGLKEFQMAPGPTARIRQLLQFVQDVVDDTPWVLSDAVARQHLEDSLLGEIIEMLPTLQPCDDVRGGEARKRLVDRACELMLSRPDQPMSILDVCKGVGASRRKLNYCFLDVLGTNPVHYLRAVRLNRVRRELKRCEDPRTGIYDIAVRWGFWHFSQFSLDYKRHFAELPSETLQRSRTSKPGARHGKIDQVTLVQRHSF